MKNSTSNASDSSMCNEKNTALVSESITLGENSSHIFDNTFLSACSWDKRLLIPLVNEIFNKNISEEAKIDLLPNEEFSHQNDDHNKDTLIKRITDALIRVNGNKYHFEAESKNDGQILLRIAEYDTLIAHNDAIYKDYSVIMQLPKTAVIFLRKHNHLPAFGTIKYASDNKILEQKIPFYMVSSFSLDYLDEKHLYILMPFYLMRYEHALKHNTSSKYLLIEKEAGRVYDVLTEAYENGIITRKEYEDILTLCNDVVQEIGKKSTIRERLVDAMGTGVLKTMEERGYDRGIIEGRNEGRNEERENGLKALVNLLKDFCPDFDSLYKKIISNETYANLTMDDVRKYY